MLITDDKVQFAREILDQGTTSVVVRNFDSDQLIGQLLTSGRDLRARQGRDVIILMGALLHERSEASPTKSDKRVYDLEMNRQVANLCMYLERGAYRNYTRVVILHTLINTLKLHIINNSFPAISHLIQSISPMIMLDKKQARTFEEKRAVKFLREVDPTKAQHWYQDIKEAVDYLKAKRNS